MLLKEVIGFGGLGFRVQGQFKLLKVGEEWPKAFLSKGFSYILNPKTLNCKKTFGVQVGCSFYGQRNPEGPPLSECL